MKFRTLESQIAALTAQGVCAAHTARKWLLRTGKMLPNVEARIERAAAKLGIERRAEQLPKPAEGQTEQP